MVVAIACDNATGHLDSSSAQAIIARLGFRRPRGAALSLGWIFDHRMGGVPRGDVPRWV